MTSSVALIGSCTAQDPALQRTELKRVQPLGSPVEPPLVEVELYPASLEGVTGHLAEERMGLTLVLLESGLLELSAVVPRVRGSVPSPGVSDLPAVHPPRWTVGVSQRELASGTSIELEVCNPSRTCMLKEAIAPQRAPWEATAALLSGLAVQLERAVSPEVLGRWERPVSQDPYAALMLGRAAATFYGLIQAPEPEAIGDRRRDALLRAMLIDPTMALTHWFLGRRAFSAGMLEEAELAFERAHEHGAGAWSFRADVAATLVPREPRRAAQTHRALSPALASDLRLTMPRARALAASEATGQAIALLDGLPQVFQGEVPVLALKAGLAKLTGDAQLHDTLLERWQRAAPRDPEPLKQRVWLRIRSGRMAEALSFARELEPLERTEEIARLTLALAVATRDWALAAQRAGELKLTNVVDALESRAALEQRPYEVPAALVRSQTLPALVVRAHVWLGAGKAESALGDANRALTLRPDMPEALAVKTLALRALGREDAALEQRRRLTYVDPAYALLPEIQGPSTAPGSTGLGSQAQSTPP